MQLPNAGDLGFASLTALAALGFASIVGERVRLVIKSYRNEDRIELIRSAIMACIMSLFVIGATYATVVRVIEAFVHSTA